MVEVVEEEDRWGVPRCFLEGGRVGCMGLVMGGDEGEEEEGGTLTFLLLLFVVAVLLGGVVVAWTLPG